jgi:plasmid maintenance system killer protein
MIKSFRNAAAKAAWERRFLKGIPNDILKTANRKLTQIHNARSLSDLKAPPGNRLEALAGDRRDSTAFGSTISGGFVFVGETAMPMTSPSSTAIEEFA